MEFFGEPVYFTLLIQAASAGVDAVIVTPAWLIN
jgi:hypothetical protein